MSDDEQTFMGWKVLHWDSKHKLLSSPNNTDWLPKTSMKAYCGLAHDLRELEHTKCHCGIYSRKDIDNELRQYLRAGVDVSVVIAQIAQWGSWLIEGSTGFRSEYAYPRTILVRSSFTDNEALSERYEVPVIVADEAFITTQGAVTKEGKTIDLSQFSTKQIEQARYQLQYRKWYQNTQQTKRNLEKWRNIQFNVAPKQIRHLEEKLLTLMQHKPSRKEVK